MDPAIFSAFLLINDNMSLKKKSYFLASFLYSHILNTENVSTYLEIILLDDEILQFRFV